ncbi:hypothetical protein DPMN_050371 [Dreissena polymorpha]|uniref:Sushi domain-containing protein n=1 Tax=Dreissena polymorpha TaxID=45954 RepID=A0A9D4CHV6_DREPO|nr:hypothetical protein DPMN_050371 [Dreissena polymorpha]
MKECTTDITILNGSAAYNDGRQYLDFAQITCYPGYRLNGTGNNNNVSESVQCLETGNWGIPRGCVRKGKLQNQVYKQILKVKHTGDWREPRGCVKKVCAKGATVENGNVSYKDVNEYLDFAQVTCFTGYKINGTGDNNNVSESLQCLHTGNWQTSQGCVKKECALSIDVENGSPSYNNGVEYLDYAEITCSMGYRIGGRGDNNNVSERLQCLDSGRWEIPKGCVKKGK